MLFDLVYLADIRFPGGTSTALFYELRAAARAGLKVGLIPVASPILTKSRAPNPKLLNEIRRTRTTIVPRGVTPQCRLCLAYHPTLLDGQLKNVPRVKADTFALVAHQPPLNRFGEKAFDAGQLSRIAEDLFGHELTILPVGPTVRQGFEAQGLSAQLSADDWLNLVDVNDFPICDNREIEGPLVIGRHSRPGREKWPDPEDAILAYPEHSRYQFRMLGVGPDYLGELDKIPSNWHCLPFTTQPVSGFLKGLDAYSYFHSPAWIEAFGYCVLEALSAGLPTVLPNYFCDWFEDAALYGTPSQAPEHYDRILDDKTYRLEVSTRARKYASNRFGLEQFGERFEKLAGKVQHLHAVGSSLKARPPRQHVVLAVTSNGIGLGHLTRQLAVAKALGPNVKTVFFSLSEAVKVAQQMGHLVEFRPFHRRLGCRVNDWNDFFYRELRDALSFYRPELVSFDGNTPYSGLLEAISDHGDAQSAWIRRGMWRTEAPEISRRASHFDLVIEPGEVAAPMDPGHARIGSDHLVHTDPVPLVNQSEMMTRATARRLLDLPLDATLGLVQLGSERNSDMSFARQAIDAVLERNQNVHFVEIKSPISPDYDREPNERYHRRTAYPLGLYLNGFDFAVSAAGYNSFHEFLASALPTVFVPNKAPEMDLQETRAEYAAKAGWCLTCDADDPFNLEGCLDEILQTQTRQDMQNKCRILSKGWKGANQIAEYFAMTAGLPTGSFPGSQKDRSLI
ncbi:glycosyltransferase [uncultured Roseibium sp.]|uniref:glycosyltransferase n=1 Tax=uncultured Roseibium sp. TaxID=1936171 RepID=UPI0026191340|nr:glycosyltransferase [uncultured Roseibium sp.]